MMSDDGERMVTVVEADGGLVILLMLITER